MKILQLCNRVPFPPKDGGSIAMYNMAKAFHALGHELTILAINTPKHFIEEKNYSGEFKSFGKIISVFVDTSVKPLNAIKNLFNDRSYNIERFISDEVKTELKKLLQSEKFDIIQIEGLFMAPYLEVIRSYSDAKVVMRAHNIEHLIWKRLAEQSEGIKKWYLQFLAKRLYKYETDVIHHFDAIITITYEDESIFRELNFRKKIFTSPAGIDLDQYISDTSKTEARSLFHLGALNWMPNQEGIKWFLNEVWHKVKDIPGIQFYIAGRDMPSDFITYQQKGIHVIGEVDNAIDFMNSKEIMIVPLFSGGGMRVKIIEGMALGKIIISTSIGAEGIDYTDKENILIADTPQQFADTILYCINHSEDVKKIGENAKRLVKEKYNNTSLVRKLLEFYTQELLK